VKGTIKVIFLRIIKSEISRNLKEFVSYRIGFISDIIVISIIYFSLIFFGSGTSLGNYYGGSNDSKTLLLLGYVFWNFSIGIVNSLTSELSSEAVKGTLEQKFMAVVPISYLILGSALTTLIIEFVEMSLIVFLSVTIAKVGIYVNWIVLLSLTITLIGMYGFSLILGGIAIKEKKIGNLNFIIQILLLFLTDTVTKTNIPVELNKIIPLTQGIDIARKSISGIAITTGDWMSLIGFTVLWLIVGKLIFNYFVNYSRDNGILGNY